MLKDKLIFDLNCPARRRGRLIRGSAYTRVYTVIMKELWSDIIHRDVIYGRSLPVVKLCSLSGFNPRSSSSAWTTKGSPKIEFSPSKIEAPETCGSIKYKFTEKVFEVWHIFQLHRILRWNQLVIYFIWYSLKIACLRIKYLSIWLSKLSKVVI